MSADQIQQMLSGYSESDYTVKLLDTLYGVIPGTPAFQFYNTFEAGIRRLRPSATDADMQRAREIASSDEFATGIKVLGYLDLEDKVIAGYAGLKNVLNLFGMGSGGQKRTFEADPQQALDAGVKAMAIAYSAYNFIPGDISAKVQAMRQIPAAIEMLIYFGAIEVALPFTDNVIEAGGDVMSRLMRSGDIAGKFSAIPGVANAAGAQGMLGGLSSVMDQYISGAKDHVGAIATKIKEYLPAMANAADSVTGAAATGADLLPVWTFLGARFAAEAVAQRLA